VAQNQVTRWATKQFPQQVVDAQYLALNVDMDIHNLVFPEHALFEP
jgi:hypothetical protein